MKILFQPFELNNKIILKNRIVMAPMTRAKATEQLVPTKEMAEYYSKRAEAGLIITEGTVIRSDALGHKHVPGIFNEEQIHAWIQVTTRVHEKNGLIFMQLWHVGRVSHPSFLKGQLPLSASATEMKGKISRSDNLMYGKSRAATIEEIEDITDSYAKAARNAIAAGFDGIEIHGANGYLIDQFLHYDTNHREDKFGGTPENMARFALDIIRACGEMIGYERVGIRLSPGAYLNEIIGDKRDASVFEYLLKQLNHYPIAYVHTGNFNDSQTFDELNNMTMTEFIRKNYNGTVIGCGGYSVEKANEAINNNQFDLIAFGRLFIANPNLINLIYQQHDLKTYDASMLATLV